MARVRRIAGGGRQFQEPAMNIIFDAASGISDYWVCQCEQYFCCGLWGGKQAAGLAVQPLSGLLSDCCGSFWPEDEITVLLSVVMDFERM